MAVPISRTVLGRRFSRIFISWDISHFIWQGLILKGNKPKRLSSSEKANHFEEILWKRKSPNNKNLIWISALALHRNILLLCKKLFKKFQAPDILGSKVKTKSSDYVLSLYSINLFSRKCANALGINKSANKRALEFRNLSTRLLVKGMSLLTISLVFRPSRTE